MSLKTDELVDRYVRLRDIKAKMKAEYDAKVKDIDAGMEKIEGLILKHFEETGAESVKTANGTAYKTTRTSATVGDWDAFLNSFVIPQGAWEFLEKRCNKSAVEVFKEENQDLPPGVNWRAETVVNIRRS